MTGNQSMIRLYALILALFLIATSAAAQSPTAMLSGVVRTPDGEPVAAATITITQGTTGTQYVISTGPQGGFVAALLPFGEYRVEVRLDGFRSYAAKGVRLEAGRAATLNITLRPGVGADWDAVDLNETTKNDAADVGLASAVDREMIDILPLFDRNPLNLLGLQAGVALHPLAPTTIDGQRASFTNITLDGANIQDNFIRANATDFTAARLTRGKVAEFSVVTQNAGPDAGLGASQVILVTPRGGNDWHGEAAWVHQNGMFAANDWFSNRAGAPAPALVKNQGAVNAGGPLAAEKVFFFGGYELFRRNQSVRTRAVLLLPHARTGIFRWTTLFPVDTGAQPLPGDVTCQSTATVIPVGTQCEFNLLNRFGLPVDAHIATRHLAPMPVGGNDSNVSDVDNTIGRIFNQRSDRTWDDYTARIDYSHSGQNSFGLTWNRLNEDADQPGLDPTYNEVPATFTDSPLDFLSSYWRFRPSARFTNEVRYGFALTGVEFGTNEDLSANVLDDATFYFTPGVADFQRQGRDTDTQIISSHGTYVRGNHSYRFGFQTQMIDVRAFTGFRVIPTWNLGHPLAFGHLWELDTSDFPGGASSTRNRAREMLASLAGVVTDGAAEFNATSRTSGFVPGAESVRDMTADSLSLYFADSWRYTPRLTVNLGLRWEFVGRFDETRGLLIGPVLTQNTREAAVAAILDTTTTYDFVGGNSGRKVSARDLDNYGPNIGIAYDLFGDGKTTLRAGFGMHFVNDELLRAADDAIQGNFGLSTTVFTGPLANTTFSGGGGSLALPAIATPAFAIPRNQPLGASAFAIDPQLENPYVMSWNVGFQREVGWNTVLEVRYHATRGVQLTRNVDFNQVIIGSLSDPNSFVSDFIRARDNGFLCEANGQGFDPQCALTGSQVLTVFPQISFGGFLSNSGIRGLIRGGEPGELVAFYKINSLCGLYQCAPAVGVGNADMLINYSQSNYHAGVVEIRRRFRNGLRWQANYTFSKVLTDSSGTGQTNFDPFLDINQQGLEYNRASFDITHQFKTNFIYALPAGEGQALSSGNDIINKLIGGWTISSIINYQTGSPFSIVINRGTLNRRSRSEGKLGPQSVFTVDEISRHFGRFDPGGGANISYIDPSFLEADGSALLPISGPNCTPSRLGFCQPEPGTVGNIRPFSFNNPNWFNWDFSIRKRTAVTERVNADFSAEFFNFTNTPTFWLGTTEDIRSTNFGEFTNTLSTRRIIQFAVRLTF